MLQLRDVRKDYVTASETVNALKGVNIAFRQKEFVSILGPSGCGKTTLLNIIGGLDHYTSGDLLIGGRSTRSYTDRDWDVYRNHRIGFIFQSYNLIPHQTVLGNVELALTIAGLPREERIRRAKHALDRVGLSDKYYKRPNQLSGGQCQRVAIARALVNDPEILLADEPTGALDTATSVQIMDLIREISGERLVIMVTHNPALAEQYSTRIVRLLDGNVVEDTNPFSPEDEEAECRAIAAEQAATAEQQAAAPGGAGGRRPRRRERAKMSFLTAFLLSARNLISKKGRTIMVGIAGSIGIIGIAMVLAFSAGIKGYVASMQDDMLSGNPIVIQKSTLDFNALSDLMSTQEKLDIVKQPNRVYINSMVEYLAKMNKNVNSMLVENEITQAYIDYVRAMPAEYYAAMLLDYGLDLTGTVYTDFRENKGGESQNISINALTSLYTSILKQTDFRDYASYVSTLAPSFSQAPNSSDYIASQYDLVAGKLAEGKDEIMLVLNGDDELSDLLLARLGYYSQDEFLEIVNKVSGGTYDTGLYRDSFTYEELLDRTFTIYPCDDVFEKQTVTYPGMGEVTSYGYRYNSADIPDTSRGLQLKVVGILSTKENVSYGCLSSGIYYTQALTEHILAANSASAFIEDVRTADENSALAKTYFRVMYTYNYTYNGVTSTDTGYFGPELSMADMVGGSGFSGMMGGAGGSGVSMDLTTLSERFVRALGGNALACGVSIYPISFETKDLVTDYLDAWNADGELTVSGAVVPAADRADVTYTDTLSLIISIINTMIDIVSYALIAFTSVSLVVSTVMIGIITYVSVVERIKEIGVIRSLGGRKRDVSHLFNAETFIIGALAGLIGIVVTYLISAVVNAVIYSLIGIRNIAALPIGQAALLVALSIGLTLISGLIPASSAAKKDPVIALRTE